MAPKNQRLTKNICIRKIWIKKNTIGSFRNTSGTGVLSKAMPFHIQRANK